MTGSGQWLGKGTATQEAIQEAQRMWQTKKGLTDYTGTYERG